MSKNSFRETEDGGDFCFEEFLSSLRDCIWWKMHFFNNTLSKEEFNLETCLPINDWTYSEVP